MTKTDVPDEVKLIRKFERYLEEAEQRRYRCRVALEAAERHYDEVAITISVLRERL